MRPHERVEALNAQRVRAGKIQVRLDELGIRLGGLTIRPGSRLPEEKAQVMDDLLTMIEAYLDGRYKPMPPLGDSVRGQCPDSGTGQHEYHYGDGVMKCAFCPAIQPEVVPVVTRRAGCPDCPFSVPDCGDCPHG